MSDANDIYNVEKILRRKLVDGKVNILMTYFKFWFVFSMDFILSV